MNNIKQKIIKLIFSFLCLITLNACESRSNISANKNMSNNIINVAILLPLSGENELLGKQYAGLIKIGLEDAAKTKIRVTCYDSSDETKLRDSIKKILEQKNQIIIGPLYSKDTKILASEIKEKDIIDLSLSNDPTLADNNIFVFGHAPMRQMEQIATYLINNDYRNYIILLPAGRHSQIVSKIVQNIITNKNAVLSRIEFYNDPNEDLERVLNIVSDTADNLNEYDENLKRPVVIVGDDQENLKRIYTIASNFNLDKKVIIAGDNRIDAEQNQSFDIIYTGATDLDNGDLKQKAMALGIHHFSFMHALAYDAGKIIASNITNNYNKETFLTKLKSSEKFQGVSGEIYFIDSIAQRKYAIIRKQNGIYTVQDSFSKENLQEEVVTTPNK
jgi:ABC-type branched-subunit amino acid transport system substrate-binding protein